ncbi:MAG: hypothetical protein GC181_16275 [Bacteroidetes bacterium]|nr:hypothetical protein [Bacteroidota bacterium]
MIRLIKLTSALLLIAVTQPSCKKLNKTVKFNLEYTTSFTIPATAGINLPFDVLTPDVETNAEESFKANDTRKDLITQILLTKLTLSIKSPPDGDFSFLKSAKVIIKADGHDDKEVAVINDVPNNGSRSLDLECTGADLAPYIKEDNFSLKVTTVTDEILSKDYTIEVYSKFQVEGKLLGN